MKKKLSISPLFQWQSFLFKDCIDFMRKSALALIWRFKDFSHMALHENCNGTLAPHVICLDCAIL